MGLMTGSNAVSPGPDEPELVPQRVAADPTRPTTREADLCLTGTSPVRPDHYHRRMAYPKRLLTDGENIVSEFRPHWRLLIIPASWLILGIIAIVLAYTVLPGEGLVDVIITLVVVVAMFALVGRPLIDWWFTLYVLTDERLIKRSGMISRSGIEIPLDNITNVLFSQNVLERVLRSGDLLIESAGESGQSRFNDIPKPQEFQSLLYRVREGHAAAVAREEGSALAEGLAADPTEQLQRLAQLHRDGIITDEEFEEKKRRLLDQI